MFKDLLTKSTGFSSEIERHLESSDRSKVKSLGAMMLFTSFSSALIMGYGISVLSFHSPALFPFVFIFWFIFVYLFERIIVSGNELKKSVLIARFIAALSFAIIHSLIIDTLFFRSDINEAFRNQQFKTENAIRESSQNKVKDLTASINQLSNQNNAYLKKISDLQQEIISEADGTSGTHNKGMGPIYDLKKRMLLPQIRILQNHIKSNKTAIVGFKSEIKATNKGADNEISTLPENHGLIAHVRMLYEIEMIHGNFISRLFSFLFFMVFVFIETLPLFARISFELKTYHNLLKKKDKSVLQLADLKIQQENQRETKKLVWSTTNQDLSDQSVLNIERMEIHYIAAKEKIRETEKIIQLLASKKQELSKKYPEYSANYLEPTFYNLENDFKKVIKQISLP